VLSGLRLKRAAQPLTDNWRQVPVEPRGATRLGISFRPLQAEALGLRPDAALAAMLSYPFQLIRLPAYWDRLEPGHGRFEPGDLDRALAAAEQAGKDVILGVGAVKNFGYPEYFVPQHRLGRPLREHALVTPGEHQDLLDAAIAFVTRVVSRYKGRNAITAWQVEHEAADPLGMEHSWRLSEAFVRAEVAAVRAADPARPVLMNAFLPTSAPVALLQGWRTRDQGDSLAMAQRLADIVGLDVYPRHALAGAGPLTVYLEGTIPARLRAQVRAARRRVLIAEGQAEPWEAVTNPPSPAGRAMYSCRPEDVITTYSRCVREIGAECDLEGYLFWGAEYWLARDRQGDPSYLRAFARVLEESG
jgi:Beta-galactosidase